jgi:hypothetical protein
MKDYYMKEGKKDYMTEGWKDYMKHHMSEEGRK